MIYCPPLCLNALRGAENGLKWALYVIVCIYGLLLPILHYGIKAIIVPLGNVFNNFLDWSKMAIKAKIKVSFCYL